MYCCERMDSAINNWKVHCLEHKHAFDCPDALVIHLESGTYGLPYHDGGSSVNVINFCPWCGSNVGEEKEVANTI